MQDRPRPTDSLIRFLQASFPGFDPETIFDVGANVGQSTKALAAVFPNAAIHAFEPVAAIFETLSANVGHLPKVRAHNLALGRRAGNAWMTQKRASPSNRIVDAPSLFERSKVGNVAIVSGDAFAAEHGIDRIGYLKVDAEGHDLEILIGFQRMFSEARIDLAEAEVGMYPGNPRHVPFEAVKAFFEPLGYRLLHIYDLALDTPFSGRPILRRANVVFASEKFIDANSAK
jgi:FkbM family methyltransferase